jgi:hypothetical protein
MGGVRYVPTYRIVSITSNTSCRLLILLVCLHGTYYYRTAAKRSYTKCTVTRYGTVFFFVQNFGNCFTQSKTVHWFFFMPRLLKHTN